MTSNGDQNIYYSLERAVASIFGNNVHITGRQPVYGGDINQSYCLTLSDGSSVFMKCNDMRNYAFFEKESVGLEALRSLGTIGVPKPLATGVDDADQVSFLLMEYLAPAPRRKDYWEVLGHELALTHRHNTKGMITGDKDFFSDSQGKLSETSIKKSSNETDISKCSDEEKNSEYGFCTDNYIGATPQMNTPKTGWIEFFRDCRLRPQMRMAEKQLDSGTREKCEILLDRLDRFLEEPAFPSLLHGDLWSGNVICGPNGKAWMIDPAVYVGHFEAEIAMTELFGGYPDSFYRAYQEINRMEPGYEDRKDLYNLYHVLNHLNLFGPSYLGEVRRIIRRFV
ncbi:MAG: fructosamine kinase family protein [Lachnospiraceae bacterium]|nr:fructosamine kinase family protein [Lachnospiraceae bacterium]